MELDHLMWLSPDVDAGVRELTASTGVAPVLGGSHPGAGTRNALLGLGEGCYLEVYGTDPAQGGGHHNGSRIAGLPTGLLTFCCRTDRLDDAVAAAAELGLRTQGPFDSARTTLSGQTLRWRLAFLEGNVHGNGLPFLIDWMDSPHPSGTAPSGCAWPGWSSATPTPGGCGRCSRPWTSRCRSKRAPRGCGPTWTPRAGRWSSTGPGWRRCPRSACTTTVETP